MTEEHSQAGLLNAQKVALLVLVSQSIQMDNAWHSGGHQPRKTQETVDAVEQSIEAQVVVVCFSMGQFVVLVGDQMPSNTVV